MIDISNAVLDGLAVHIVGNKHEEEGITVSKELYELKDEELEDLLHSYFLNSFEFQEAYQFHHETDRGLNELYNYCSALFEDPESLLEQSVNILKHLYEQSTHPRIKSGDLYVSLFSDCVVEDEMVQAIGIFKAETRNNYLQVNERNNKLLIEHAQGTDINKLDKGALILNFEKEDGYRLFVVDHSNQFEARYWRDDFLGILQIKNEAFHTKNYLNLCQKFCKDVYAKEADKKEQVLFLNKSFDYFSSQDSFDVETFTEQVLPNAEGKQAFRQFKETFEEKHELEPAPNFIISKPSVEKMKQRFRSLIKLDTSIEIRLNSGQENKAEQYIERAFDEQRQMHYYKIFFNSEK